MTSKKVSILDNDTDKTISFHEIKLGKYYKLNYIFGRYHPTNNNIYSGNTQVGNRKITITDVPFLFTLKRDELERAFNTDRLKLRQTTITDKKTLHNYQYNPNSDKREERRKYNIEEDNYRITYDISKQVFDYFMEEYNRQYPDLKQSQYKNSMSIINIEKGALPTIKYIHIRNKFNDDITFGLTIEDDEKEIRKKLYDMTKEEIDIFHKKRTKLNYKKSDEDNAKYKKEWEIKINDYFKKHNIILESRSKYEEFGFRLLVDNYDMRIEFMTTDNEIASKIDNVIKEDFGEYKLKDKVVREGYNFKKDGMIFILLYFEVD